MKANFLSVRAAAAFGLCLLLALGNAAAAQAPRVVASILPLHSLTAAVMEGVGEPELLVPGAASPHSFSLRPSDARSLEEAALVIWIGEELELFLEQPLRNLAEEARLVTVSEIAGLKLRASRPAGLHRQASALDISSHQHDDAEEEADPHEHHHGEHDMHLWLDPRHALLAAEAVAEALVELDPAQEARYRENLKRLKGDLRQLEQRTRARLLPYQDESFLVFHDAYQYFEEAFGLRSAGSLTLGAERQPGARRLQEIRDWIKATGSLCLFAEPQFEPRLLSMLAQETAAEVGVLDPLGADLVPGPAAYVQLIDRLAGSLVECFEGVHP